MTGVSDCCGELMDDNEDSICPNCSEVCEVIEENDYKEQVIMTKFEMRFEDENDR